jgi:hypothetical protein
MSSSYRRKASRRTQPERRSPEARRTGPRAPYGRAWATTGTSGKAYLKPPAYGSRAEVPEEIQDRALEKLGWIQAFVAEGCPRGQLKAFAERHAAYRKLPDSAIPRYTTLTTWVHRYRAFGFLGLCDGVRRDQDEPRAMTEEGQALLKTAIEAGVRSYTTIKTLLDRHTPPLADAQLAWRPREGEAPVDRTTSIHVVRRVAHAIERRSPHAVAYARHGPLWFRNHFQLAFEQGVYPGGWRLAIDSTVADIWAKIRDPRAKATGGWRAVRPVLTLIEDVGTRLYVTHNLSVHYAVNSGICLGTLQRAIQQDHNYPGLISTGVPREMSCDKGSEHQGAFRKALKKLGITVVPRIHNDPQGGARIERLIQTVQVEVFAHEPGYSKTERIFDPYAPPEQDAKRTLTQLQYDKHRMDVDPRDLLTVRELEERLLAWAVDYNARPHRSLPTNDARTQRLIAAATRRTESVMRGHADGIDLTLTGGPALVIA